MTDPVPQQDAETTQQNETTEKVIARAVGGELRRNREATGWSRNYFVARLPSGIGERTLLSYEHGTPGTSPSSASSNYVRQ